MPGATLNFGDLDRPKRGSRPSRQFGANFMVGPRTLRMKISPDFREFIACANAREVRFLIVGGYAVAYHGHPRYTKDLDVWVEPTTENARRLLNTLEDFGFGALDLQAEDFLEFDSY